MSIAANSAPAWFRASTVRAEKPQRGKSGVPFMKSITRFCEIAFWISSRIWSSVMIMAPPS